MQALLSSPAGVRFVRALGLARRAGLILAVTIILAFILIPILGPAPGARTLSWAWTGGPEGAFVLSMLTTPSGTLLAGTENGGLYRSTDAGATWTAPDEGLTWPCCNYGVPSLAASATAIYAGTWGGGVYRSDDDGVTWYATGAIPNEGYPVILGIAACFHGERVYACGQFGVVRSDDGGATWSALDTGLPGAWARGLALRGTVLYARLDQNIYRLDPQSETWSPWETGLPGTFGMQSIRASNNGLYLSTHDGGVFVLDCDDAEWTAWNNGLYDDNVDATIEVDETLYAGLMGGGAFRYDWAQGQWMEVSDGLWNRDIRAMTGLGTTPYAGTFGGGIFAFDRDAATWDARNSGVASPLINSIVTDGAMVYAAGEGCGVYRSDDDGETWTAASNGLGERAVFALTGHAGDLYVGSWGGVWRSIDQAQNWTYTNLTGEGVFAMYSSGTILYAGTFDGDVYTTTNGGDDWTELGTGLPNGTVRGIARLGTALYAAVNDQGVYRLLDGQSTWTSMNAGLPEFALGALVVSDGMLFVGLSSQGVYRWNPGAQQWEARGLANQAIFALVETPDGLMAGTWGELQVTTDGGDTWTLETEGMKPWLAVRAIAAGDDDYYAGLSGGGIYRAPRESGAVELDGELGADTTTGGAAGDNAPVLAVQPNPVQAGTRVSFTLARVAEVELAVFDPAGRRIATLASGSMSAGAHAIRWDGVREDGARMEAGVYFVKLRVGGDEWTAKEVRVR